MGNPRGAGMEPADTRPQRNLSFDWQPLRHPGPGSEPSIRLGVGAYSSIPRSLPSFATVALGVSFESGDTYAGGSAGAGAITLPAAFAPDYSGQLDTEAVVSQSRIQTRTLLQR